MSGTITRIEAFEVILPLPTPLRLGSMFIPHREYALVRMYDGEGNVGAAYSLSRNAPIGATVKKTIAPYWKDQALDDHEALYAQTVKANVCLGTNGIFWRGLSLVDCALYDLLAQRAGQPLWEYLGGSLKEIPVMLVGGYPSPDETPESLSQQMQEMAAHTPSGIKIASCSDHARDTERLKICRQAIPDGTPLMIDLHWNGGAAETLLPEAQKWEAFNMGWLEDPFAFDDFENVAKLADELSYPVAVGDEQSGVRHFRRLLEQGRIDIARLDPHVCGGIRAFREIADIAAQLNRPIACHGSLLLNAHLAAAIPNVRWVEYLPPDLEPVNLLFTQDLEPQHGCLRLDKTPGVGYRWNASAITH